MVSVTLYSKQVCPYCVRAKQLLTQKGITPVEVDIEKDPTQRSEMIAKSGGRTTVPQIFIGSFHVGGCDDLYALERQGKLDGLLRGETAAA
jgi:glutaredoxin 3